MPESTNKTESSSYKSQKATIASLGLLEKLDTIPALLSVCMSSSIFLPVPLQLEKEVVINVYIVGNVITALFTSVIRPKDKKPSAGLYKYVMLTALRTMVRRTSVRQQQYFPLPFPPLNSRL
jgi:hypothetical protein